MAINVDELRSRVAKPKFVPKSKRGKKVLAAAVKMAEAAPQVDEPVELPSWRLELEAKPEPERVQLLSWAEKPLEQMSERDWRVMARDLGLEISSPAVRPLRSWSDLPHPEIRQIVAKLGYNEPTPVQRATIPLGLAKHDVVGIAETGSGKTAGFVVPVVAQTPANPHVSSLILAPTRELAQQIYTEALKFATPLGIKAACLVGGHDLAEQAPRLVGAALLVATPGRLIDALQNELVSLARCRVLVLDEADRMVDMGFEEQVAEIAAQLPARQTLMFSATWPPAIEQMANRFLRDPVRVAVGGGPQANARVTQRAELVEAGAKLPKLFEALGRRRPVIVFVNQKATADEVSAALTARGVRAAAMHGDRTQDQREEALAGLRSGSTAVLVATDVAGRGIDIPNVELVVNYDMPRRFDAYVHRIGRTGRAGRTGQALSLCTAADSALFGELRAAIAKSRSPVPPFLKSVDA